MYRQLTAPSAATAANPIRTVLVFIAVHSKPMTCATRYLVEPANARYETAQDENSGAAIAFPVNIRRCQKAPFFGYVDAKRRAQIKARVDLVRIQNHVCRTYAPSHALSTHLSADRGDHAIRAHLAEFGIVAPVGRCGCEGRRRNKKTISLFAPGLSGIPRSAPHFISAVAHSAARSE